MKQDILYFQLNTENFVCILAVYFHDNSVLKRVLGLRLGPR